MVLIIKSRFFEVFDDDQNIIFTELEYFISFSIDGAGDLNSSGCRLCQVSCSFTEPSSKWPERSVLQITFFEILRNAGIRGRYHLSFDYRDDDDLNAIWKIFRPNWSELE